MSVNLISIESPLVAITVEPQTNYTAEKVKKNYLFFLQWTCSSFALQNRPSLGREILGFFPSSLKKSSPLLQFC